MKKDIYKDWLVIIDDGGKISASCTKCSSSLVPKLSVINAHLKCQKHQAQIKSLHLNKKIDETMNMNIKKNEIYSALFVACHTSISTSDHLLKCHKKLSDDSNIHNMTLKRTKCTAVINAIAKYFLEKIREDISDSPFSVIIDESTDISVTKFLGIVIKYYSVSKQKISTVFLKLQELEKCDSDGIVESLKSLFVELKLDLKNMCGIGTDNAAVMTGIHNSVYTKLRNENPLLILIPCICHSLQLAVSHAARQTIPNEVEYIIEETYAWFSKSSNRQLKYKILYELINNDLKTRKFTRSCETRWLSILPAVNRISEQWLELGTYFNMSKDISHKAETLSILFSKNENLVYLKFLQYILTEVDRVNDIFQSRNANITKIVDDLIHLLKFVCFSMINRDIPHFNIFESKIEESMFLEIPYIGCRAEQEIKKLNTQQATLVRQKCIEFLHKLFIEIRSRTPKNIEVFNKIKCFDIANILVLTERNKSKLINVLDIYEENLQQRTKLLDQASQLSFVNWTEKEDSLKFWTEVYNYSNSIGQNPFHDLAKFVFRFYVLPFSNAEVERAFSQMNICKSKLRNRMGSKLLNSLITVRYFLKTQDKCCHDYDVPDDLVKRMNFTIYNDSEECEKQNQIKETDFVAFSNIFLDDEEMENNE